MFRVRLRASRLLAVGAPALLLAVLLGCGRQEAPQVAQAPPEATADAVPPAAPPEAQPAKPRTHPDEVDEETPRIKSEIQKLEQSIKAIKKIKQDQETLNGRTDLLRADRQQAAKRQDEAIQKLAKAIKGGDGKAGDPKAEAKPGDAKPAPTGYNALKDERYGSYAENEFRSPLAAALSTFSADVNTASYSNVRRMLMEGELPPKDAVFLAEFVNYFPYSYAKPKGDDPVAFHVEMGPCPWNRKHHLVRVGVQAHQIPADKMPARNLVFLIDTSGSMQQENRLPLVQKSLALLVEKLTEKDRVSIVTYAGDSRVALMPTKGSDKKTIMSMIDGLSAGGGTNGEGGIRKAYELAKETFIADGVNRVILCTDGDFNVGVTDNGELVKMIEEQRKSKVFLTCLGYGMGNYKDDRLKELANHGNGHHAYIDTLDEAKKVFVEQGGALVCVAKDVKFQVDFNPAKVNAYRLVGYENRLLKDEDFRDDTKDAGDMGSGHQVTVLYEIVPKGVDITLPGFDPSKVEKKDAPARAPAGPRNGTNGSDRPGQQTDEWLTVKMRYKHPEAETSKELAQALKGDVGKELSDDFRFAAAAVSFGMILRDSKFRGAMTYAGVLEEAAGCLGDDPNGHRKQFLELVRTARELAGRHPDPDAARGSSQ